MNKKQQQSADTCKRIAAAAKQLFIQQGYAATSIEQIVVAAKCSKGNVYYHFKSKAGLFVHLLDEWDAEWLAKWESGKHRYATAEEQLYGMAELLVTNDLNHPLMKAADEFFGENWVDHTIQTRLAEVVNGHIRFNERLLAAGVQDGEFANRNARQLGAILESMWIGLSEISRYRQLGLQEALEMYKDAVEVFLHGIKRDIV